MASSNINDSLAEDIRVTDESIGSLDRIRKTGNHRLSWDCLFTLPEWMDAWLTCCGVDNDEVRITSMRQKEKLLGIAPLLVNGNRVTLIGSPDLCDYLDFPVIKERAQAFYSALLLYLSELGTRQFDLGVLREDSTVVDNLPGIAEQHGWQVQSDKDEESYEMILPETWDEYLSGLKSKQRHEVRRKLRRLSEKADFNLRAVETPEALGENFDTFLDLFRQSRVDKKAFLTENRLTFFRRLTANMAAARMLRLYILDIDRQPAACALCFEDAGTLYLYNSGYDPKFASLSAGQLCTVLTIQTGIANGLKRYNFLKGDEVYKKRLGGRRVQLLNLKLTR